MKLENKTLSIGMEVDDMKLLHSELSQLGFTIASDEIYKCFFGPSTDNAVRDFQKANGLNETGIVDQNTAMEVNRRVDALQSSSEQPSKAEPKSDASRVLPSC